MYTYDHIAPQHNVAPQQSHLPVVSANGVNTIPNSYIKSTIDAINTIDELTASIEGVKQDVTSYTDDILLHIHTAGEDGNNVHAFWNAVYDELGLSYRIYDATSNEMVTVEGDKAEGRIATYKSQSKKAYGVDQSMPWATWADMKKAIARVKSELEIDTDEALKTLAKVSREAAKAGTDITEWLAYIEGMVTNKAITPAPPLA